MRHGHLMSVHRLVRRAAQQEADKLGVKVEFGERSRHACMVLDGTAVVLLSARPQTGQDNNADWARQAVRRHARGIR